MNLTSGYTPGSVIGSGYWVSGRNLCSGRLLIKRFFGLNVEKVATVMREGESISTGIYTDKAATIRLNITSITNTEIYFSPFYILVNNLSIIITMQCIRTPSLLSAGLQRQKQKIAFLIMDTRYGRTLLGYRHGESFIGGSTNCCIKNYNGVSLSIWPSCNFH